MKISIKTIKAKFNTKTKAQQVFSRRGYTTRYSGKEGVMYLNKVTNTQGFLPLSARS